jgi:hypothetical protein
MLNVRPRLFRKFLRYAGEIDTTIVFLSLFERVAASHLNKERKAASQIMNLIRMRLQGNAGGR